MGKLVDFVDDDEPDRSEMTPHDFSGKNRLQGFRGRDENTGWNCGLLPPFGWRGVAVSDRDGEFGELDQTLDAVDDIAVQSPEGCHVDDLDAVLFGRSKRFQD